MRTAVSKEYTESGEPDSSKIREARIRQTENVCVQMLLFSPKSVIVGLVILVQGFC